MAFPSVLLLGSKAGSEVSPNGISITIREDAMIDPKMTLEVPPQVREFAEKSVDQAERAISSFLDTASKSVAAVPGPMTEVAKQVLEITEAGLKAQFEHARKLMQAKSIHEVMELQSDFIRDQFGAATDHFKKMTNSAASAGREGPQKTTT